MSTSAVTASQDKPPSALLAALNRAQQRICILEQENNQLRQEIRWIDKLLAVPASIMSPSHKVTLRAATKAYLSGTPNQQGLVSIESWKVCKMAGQSKDTFLNNLTYCAEKLGILRKQVERPGTAASLPDTFWRERKEESKQDRHTKQKKKSELGGRSVWMHPSYYGSNGTSKSSRCLQGCMAIRRKRWPWSSSGSS